MTVWIIIFLVAGATIAGLWRSGRFNRTALEMLGVACLIGLAGYAWKGAPTLPETLAQPSAPVVPDAGGQK
jgi:hypothetical protein